MNVFCSVTFVPQKLMQGLHCKNTESPFFNESGLARLNTCFNHVVAIEALQYSKELIKASSFSLSVIIVAFFVKHNYRVVFRVCVCVCVSVCVFAR